MDISFEDDVTVILLFGAFCMTSVLDFLEPVIWRIFTQSYSFISFVQDVGRTIRKHRVGWQGSEVHTLAMPVQVQAISKNTCLRGGSVHCMGREGPGCKQPLSMPEVADACSRRQA